jgi:asparagine synthase (glutamine-hydrolysing)
MRERMSHRGSDGSHRYLRSGDGIGLCEISLDAFASGGEATDGDAIEFSDTVVLLDGGVTNRSQIRSGLPGNPAKALSDRQLVALAYRTYGADCLAKLNGPMAAAIWNKRTKTMLISRDKLGERTLYHAVDRHAKRLIFASEIKAIIAEGSVKPELDLESLTVYLAFGFVPGDRTLFKNIKKLWPGERLAFDAVSGATAERYWTPPPIVDGEMDETTCLSRIRELFLEALERYVGDTREIAVLLSGGIDSSLIVAGLREIGVPRIGTFTVGFDVPGKDKLKEDCEYARLVAQRFDTEHHEVNFQPGFDPLPGLRRVVRQLDDLIITPNTWSRDALVQATKRAGFNAVFGGATFEGGLGAPKTAKKILRKTDDCESEEDRIFKLRSGLFKLPAQEALLKAGPRLSKEGFLEMIREQTRHVKGGDFIRRLPYCFLPLRLADKSLRELEAVGAMNAVDCRSPHLDPILVDFATQMPVAFDDGEKPANFKLLMKNAFADVLPEAVLTRRVIGFPSYYWNNGELDGLQKRLLGHEMVERAGVFDYDEVQKILDDDRRSDAKSAGKRSWALTQFALWYQEHFLGSGATREPEPALV